MKPFPRNNSGGFRFIPWVLLLLLTASCGGDAANFRLEAPSLLVILPGQTYSPQTGPAGLPDEFTAGEDFTVQILAIDEEGEILSGFSDTVGVLTSDPNDSAPPLAAVSAGVAEIPLTALTAGSFTITPVHVTASPTPLPGIASRSYTVLPGPASALAVLLPGEELKRSDSGPFGCTPDPDPETPPDPLPNGCLDPESQQVGAAFSVQVIATDAVGNPVPSAAGTVTLTTNDTKDLEPAPESLAGGEAAFDVTPVLASGNTRVQATVDFAGGASNFYEVLSQPADRLIVLLPTQSLQINATGPQILGTPPDQTTGEGFIATVLATDSFGNVDTTAGFSVTLTTTDPNDLDPINASLTSGQLNQLILPATAQESATITADDGGPLLSGTSSSFEILFGGADRLAILLPGQSLVPGPTGFSISGSAPDQQVGTPFNATIWAVDFFGNADTGASGSVTVETPDDALDTDPGSATLSSGTVTVQITHAHALPAGRVAATRFNGDAGESQNYDVLGATPASLVLVLPGEELQASAGGPIIAGTPSAQIAGGSFQLWAYLADSFGNPSEGFDREITVVTPSDGADTEPDPAMTADGLAIFNPVAITASGAYFFSGSATALPPASSGAFAVTTFADRYAVVLPGQSLVISSGGFSLSGSPQTQQPGAPFPASVYAVDLFGNVDTDSTRLTSVTTSDTLDTHPAPQNLVSGTAAFSISNVLAASGQTLTCDDGIGGFAAQVSTSYTTDAVADRLLVLPPNLSHTVGAAGPVLTGTLQGHVAGASFQAAIRAIDAFGNIDGDATPTVTVSTPLDAADTEPAPAALAAGQGNFSVTPLTADPAYTIEAASGGLATGVSPGILIAPGTASRLVITLPGQSIVVGAGGPTVSPAAGDLTAGVAVSVGVTATDTFGNKNTSVGVQVDVSSNDPAAGVSSAVLDEGFRSYPFTPYTATAGGLSITAVDGAPGTLVDGAQGGLTVISASATQLLVLFPGEDVTPSASGPQIGGTPDPQEVGTLFSFDVQGLDPFGNLDPAASVTVNVVTDDPGDVEPADAALAGGTVSFDLTPSVEGLILVTATDISSGSLTASSRTYRAYPLFLGQIDGSSNGAGLAQDALTNPVSLAFDESILPPRVYVADAGNHRILGWSDMEALVNGAPADLVIGQADFVSGSANRGLGTPDADRLNNPRGLAVDSSGNLWVSDSLNNRTLRFNDPFGTDQAADLVIGQSGFTSGGCGASSQTLCGPQGITVGPSGELYVADAGNHRVLRFASPQSTNQAAGLVLGQSSFAGADCNRSGASPTDKTLCAPQAVVAEESGGTLTRLLVADMSNSRVVGYPAPLSTDESATLVLGHLGFTSDACDDGGQDEGSLCLPQGLALGEDGNLFVSDTSNNRLLRFLAPLSNGGVADSALGQPDFAQDAANNPALGPTTFSSPRHIGWWAGVVFISDSSNNRVVLRKAP